MSGFRARTGEPAATGSGLVFSALPGISSESPPTGHGASADDKVKVSIGEDGLVDTVSIDPRALKQGSDALARLAREAARAAQEDWFGRLAEQEPAQDPQTRLRARLEEIGAEYSQQMGEINRVIAGLMRDR